MSTVDVNEVVSDIAGDKPLLVKVLVVVTKGKVRDVLAVPPHVRRSEELAW